MGEYRSLGSDDVHLIQEYAGSPIQNLVHVQSTANHYELKRPVALMNSVKASQPEGERTPFHEKGVSVDWSARMSFCRSRVYVGQWKRKWSRFSLASLHAGHAGSESLSIERNSFRGATFSAN
jgi:hypothetical protein